MTDMFQLSILDVQDDSLKLEVVLLYPDAEGPGGHGFAQHALRALVERLNQPAHPYLKALEQYSDAKPNLFIRSVHILTGTHDPEQAELLQAFASKYSDLTGPNTWTIAVRVCLPQWLEGLEAGMSETTSASNTESFICGSWHDHSSTQNMALGLNEMLKQHCATYGSKEAIPSFLLGLEHLYYQGDTTFVGRRGDDCDCNRYTVQLLEHEDAEHEKDLGIYVIGFCGNATLYLVRPTPTWPWTQSFVYVSEYSFWDWPMFRPEGFYGNFGHFMTVMMSRAIEHEERPVFREMYQQDSLRLAAWIDHEGFDTSWTRETASSAFIDALMLSDVNMNLFYVVLDDLVADLSERSMARQAGFLSMIDTQHDVLYAEIIKGGAITFPTYCNDSYQLFCFLMLKPQDYQLYLDTLTSVIGDDLYDELMMALMGLFNANGAGAIPDAWAQVESLVTHYDYLIESDMFEDFLGQLAWLATFFETHQRSLPDGFGLFRTQLEKRYKTLRSFAS